MSSGSTTARRGSIDGLRRLALTRCVGTGEDGVASDFAAGTGGSGNGDAGGGWVGERASGADDFEVVQRVAGVGEKGGDGLGGIERAAAAEGDDEIAIAGGGADEVERGFARDGEGDGRYAGGGEGLSGGVERARATLR